MIILLRAATALLCALALPAAAGAEFGRVELVQGVVTLISPKGRFVNPKIGTAVETGSEIVTAVGGELHVATADGGYLAVRPDTQLRIDRYTANGGDGDELHLSIAKGAVRMLGGWIARYSAARSRVQTPTATVEARSTDHETAFVAEAAPGQTRTDPPGSYEEVNEGSASLRGDAGTVEVVLGKAGVIPLGRGAPYVLATSPQALRGTRNEGAITKKRAALAKAIDRKRADRRAAVTRKKS
ncbi:MAG TPA: hypothetical protein VM074_11260 [Solimonas sp.]|nr:hypothetical protein [Solimonas sp.]